MSRRWEKRLASRKQCLEEERNSFIKDKQRVTDYDFCNSLEIESNYKWAAVVIRYVLAQVCRIDHEFISAGDAPRALRKMMQWSEDPNWFSAEFDLGGFEPADFCCWFTDYCRDKLGFELPVGEVHLTLPLLFSKPLPALNKFFCKIFHVRPKPEHIEKWIAKAAKAICDLQPQDWAPPSEVVDKLIG